MTDHDKIEESAPTDKPSPDWSLTSDWGRIASLVVALGYLLISPFLYPSATWSHFMAALLIRILLLAFPLACIWFADDLGEFYRDGTLAPEITTGSSGKFVRWGGWLLLLLPGLLYLLTNLLDHLYG